MSHATKQTRWTLAMPTGQKVTLHTGTADAQVIAEFDSGTKITFAQWRDAIAAIGDDQDTGRRFALAAVLELLARTPGKAMELHALMEIRGRLNEAIPGLDEDYPNDAVQQVVGAVFDSVKSSGLQPGDWDHAFSLVAPAIKRKLDLLSEPAGVYADDQPAVPPDRPYRHDC